ncbi:MAG TPA: A24 family peptidase [Acidimicrobiales bacterium]|nr:A24 family peptidase [Acidimicrobiales bacterium]
MSDAVALALSVVAGLLAAPFLTTLIEQVPVRRPVRWPSPAVHPPILYWVRQPAHRSPGSAAAAGDPPDEDEGDGEWEAGGEVVDVDVDADADAEPEARAGPLPRNGGLTAESLTPVLFALAVVRFGASWVVLPFWVCFAALLVVSVIDIQHYRIPDRVVFPALAISLPAIVVVSVALEYPRSISYALIGALAYFLLLFLAHLVYPAGMGFGDVKLALLMGLFLGWIAPDGFRAFTLVLYALMIGCLLGVLVGGVLALVRRKNAAFPFGPALAASTVVAVLFSEQLLGTG